MKTGMFVLLAVLLWGGEAMAQAGLIFPVEVPYACDDMDIIFNGSTTLATCKNGQWSKLAEPCLATMEAAMRAMDEFVPKRHTTSFISSDTLEYTHCDDACEERRIIELAEGHLAEVKRMQAAITQWDEAKKNCWGKP